MEDTLRVVNQLEAEGVIGKYAIGGAVAMIFYTEPVHTNDLDIFCSIPSESSKLIVSLEPIYSRLRELGYTEVEAEGVKVAGIFVQFLSPPPNSLEAEAVASAEEVSMLGIPTRVMGYEYLLAIACNVGRSKDKTRIAQALESREPDKVKLNEILTRYDLLGKWRKINV